MRLKYGQDWPKISNPAQPIRWSLWWDFLLLFAWVAGHPTTINKPVISIVLR